MKYLLYISVFLLTVSQALAQDVHFTQFYASPLSLNPAITGNFNQQYRVGINYRNQWGSVTVPYNTASLFFELNYLQGKLFNGDWMSSGIMVIGDKAGDGNLTVTKTCLSYAYHKALTKDGSLILSAGASLYYVHKWIDFSKLKFDSQWDRYGFSDAINHGEDNSNSSLGYVDVQAGISVLYVHERFNFTVGGAMIHLNNPVESFLGTSNRIEKRALVHLISTIKISDKFFVHPGFHYMTQHKANEIIFGANLSTILNTKNNNNFVMFFGLWARNRDALIALIGGEIKHVRLLISYDLNLSKLMPASHTTGGIELSLVYTGGKKQSDSHSSGSKYPCPRF